MSREVFVHPSGKRESEAELEKKYFLGCGSYANVYAVEVNIGGHRHTMALKEYKEDKRGDMAKRSVDHYLDAKAAGLKVFTTYRLNRDKNSILMTIGNDEEKILLGQSRNIDTREEFSQKSIERIDNFEQLMDDLYQQVQKATQNNFSLTDDSIFFLLDRKTGHVDFVFGDFDLLWKLVTPDLERWNLEKMEDAVERFLDVWVSPKTRSVYMAKINLLKRAEDNSLSK